MMKKSICAFLLTAFLLLPLQITVFGDEQHDRGIQSTEEIVVETADGLNNLEGGTKGSGLIWVTSLQLAKTGGGQLVITASTDCVKEVTKCGFTYIKLQRFIGGSWIDYTAYCYYDLYNNSSSKSFVKYMSVPKGYRYRVTCEHYAEKQLLGILKIKQKLLNTTTTIDF